MQTSIGQASAFAEGRFPAGRAESASAPNAPASGSSNSATVTANDFLQLLVTEMKNQDPTANTDPNEYINQLVQVNSLQQLIQINQDLGGSSSASGTSGRSVAPGGTAVNAANAAPENSAGQNAGTRGAQSGNLPAPASSAAATRVAEALQPGSTRSPYASLQNLVHERGRGSTVSNTINMAR